MVNWTDPVIHWNQLGSSQLKRLIATWGKDEAFIAKYDKKHGIEHTPLKHPAPVRKSIAKAAEVVKVTKTAKTKVAAKSAPMRQKHTGADGEVKFVEHRNLYVGFYGGKVVVTKRTQEQCLAVLRNEYKLEV
jgi:hypothetical protein